MPDEKPAPSSTETSVPVPKNSQEDPALTHPWGAEFLHLPMADQPVSTKQIDAFSPLIGEHRHSDSFGRFR